MKELKHLKLLCILLLVACLTGFTSDIYTPSFFKIAQDLNTSIENVQESMSIFMLAVSFSQLLYGPISEVIGRRLPLMVGLVVMSIGNVLSFYAASGDYLLVGRFIQGMGVGACACLWRSIFRDSFDSTQMAKYGSYLGIIMVFIVAASPALGGYLESYFKWRASFAAVIIYALVTLLLVYYFLPETSTHHHKSRLSIHFFKDAFSQLFKSPIFTGYVLCTFLTYGAFFSWFVVGPVLMIDHIGITPVDFGLINLFLGGTAMVLAGIFNGKMIASYGRYFMLRLGWGLIFSAGVIMMICNVVYGQTLLFTMFSIFIFLFGATLIWPSAFAGAFAPFGMIAGCAGSLYSFMQLGGGAVIGWVSTFLPIENPYSLPMIFIMTSMMAWIIFEGIVKPKEMSV